MTEGARERLEEFKAQPLGGNLLGVTLAYTELLDIADDMAARLSRYEAALRRIADWDLPPSGEFYPNADGSVSDRPAPYDSFYAYGSMGGKEAIRQIALEALNAP